LVGAGLTKAGFGAIVWPGLLTTGAFIVLAPLFGFCLALALILIVSWAFVRANPRTVEPVFQWLQFAAASLISLGHGGNDAQKTMGIIAVLLFSEGMLDGEFYVPFWVVITCQAAIALGTLIGGWRIVRTVGSKITRMTPVQGCCASAGGAIMLFAATYLGIPVSTTHTVTGAIIGVGAARKVSAVRWNIAANIVIAWVVTLPASGLMAALSYVAVGFFSR
jgi:PiT family inorganic phosphate transporter